MLIILEPSLQTLRPISGLALDRRFVAWLEMIRDMDDRPCGENFAMEARELYRQMRAPRAACGLPALVV